MKECENAFNKHNNTNKVVVEPRYKVCNGVRFLPVNLKNFRFLRTVPIL